jgi:AcrR family transcriptional regulator
MPDASPLAPKDPQERRRRILAAAVEVLTDKGYAGARIADIAALAGTSPALVVYHFQTLDGALAEALGSTDEVFYDDVARLAPSSLGALERLRVLGRLACETGPTLGSWALWMEVWVRALRDGQARTLRRALDVRWRQALREVIDSGVGEGVFTCADPQASALRLSSLMDGLAVQVALRDPDVDDERMLELWLQSAAAEVGVDASLLLGPATPGPSHP